MLMFFFVFYKCLNLLKGCGVCFSEEIERGCFFEKLREKRKKVYSCRKCVCGGRSFEEEELFCFFFGSILRRF